MGYSQRVKLEGRKGKQIIEARDKKGMEIRGASGGGSRKTKDIKEKELQKQVAGKQKYKRD